MWPDQIEGATMQGNNYRILQRPAETGSRQAERGWRRKNTHFRTIDMPCQCHSDTEEERITGGKHHDGRSPKSDDSLDGAFEWAQPAMPLAGNQGRR